MNRWFKNLRSGVFLALSVIIVTSIVTFYLFSQIINEARISNQTAQVTSSLDNINSHLKTGEIAIRDYLLLADTSFLRIYYDEQKQTWGSYDSLKRYLSDHPWSEMYISDLQELMQKRFSYLDYMRLRFDEGRLDSLEKTRMIRLGITAMSDIKTIITQIADVQETEESGGFTTTENHIQNTRMLVGILLLMSLTIILVSFFVLIKSQREISQREQRYRNLFELSREIIFTMGSNYEIIDINSAVMENLGYSGEELKAAGFLSIFTESSRMFLIQIIENLQQVTNSEVHVYARNHEIKTFLISLILVDKQNKLYQGLLFNIHERVTLEEERVSLERFANVGRVARLIAHEVRNPITNINLAVEAIHSYPQQEEISDYLKIIVNNSNRINSLISELLSTTKLSEFNFEAISINNLLDETIEAASDRIRLNRIRLEKSYDSEICEVIGDPEKLKIAFLNIIVNAIEAMPENGQLKIATKKAGNKCIVAIEDNGSGISEAHLKQIYQPFFSTKKNGTGLGLATTQTIILHHKGTIQLESKESEGTKFYVSLRIPDDPGK